MSIMSRTSLEFIKVVLSFFNINLLFTIGDSLTKTVEPYANDRSDWLLFLVLIKIEPSGLTKTSFCVMRSVALLSRSK